MKKILKRNNTKKIIKKIQKNKKNKTFKYHIPETGITKVPVDWETQKTTWLSNYDIMNGMKFYEKKYDDFHFLEPSSIDFDKKDENGKCQVSELCRYNLELLCHKYKYFATVFNTSKSYEDGRHWIAMFIHIPRREIYFYDSIADTPPLEVQALLLKFKKQGNIYLYKKHVRKNKTNSDDRPQTDERIEEELRKNKIKSFRILYNTRHHQLLNTECGIYSLFFISSMLKQEKFSNFCRKPIDDSLMTCFRSKFFRDDNKIYKTECKSVFKKLSDTLA